VNFSALYVMRDNGTGLRRIDVGRHVTSIRPRGRRTAARLPSLPEAGSRSSMLIVEQVIES
jgi:hypothetical protein